MNIVRSIELAPYVGEAVEETLGQALAAAALGQGVLARKHTEPANRAHKAPVKLRDVYLAPEEMGWLWKPSFKSLGYDEVLSQP